MSAHGADVSRVATSHRMPVALAALAAVVIALILIEPVVSWTKFLAHDAAPAWIQAVGSVLALGITGWAAVHQTSRAAKLEARRVSDRLRARSRLLAAATQLCVAFLEAHRARPPGGDMHAIGERLAQSMLVAAEHANRVDPSEMPTEQAVLSLLSWREHSEPLFEVVKHQRDRWLTSPEQEAFANSLNVVLHDVSRLYEEADRLERAT